MLLFISGPMSGIPNHNRDAFHAAAALLRAHGYYVISPAELRPEQHEEIVQRCTRKDLQILVSFPVDGLATLPDGPEIHPDYPPSRGMATERYLATNSLRIPVRSVSEWLTLDPLTGAALDLAESFTAAGDASG